MFLNIKTEYSFKKVYGPISKVADWLQEAGATAACISDLHNTFGHVPWRNALKERGIKPVYGCTFSVAYDLEAKRKASLPAQVSVVALNNTGLTELYELVRRSYDQFYYIPRLSYDDLNAASSNLGMINVRGLDKELLKRPVYDLISIQGGKLGPLSIAGQDNYYINNDDRLVAELLTGEPMSSRRAHLATPDELKATGQDVSTALRFSEELLDLATAEIPTATQVRYPENRPGLLRELCDAGAARLNCDLTDPVYSARLERELGLIEEKDFGDYFLVVADLVGFAKRHMLVGPSRGSSAGSLVCYLLGITTIDPIPFDLLFERFIDVNRADLPDIDIDFPDSKRHLVIEYLEQKYGTSNVCHIGTVGTLGPKSAINMFAKGLRVPSWEADKIKDAIIERSTGDARAAMCLEDTLDSDAGKDFITKYPKMRLAAAVEGHASFSGTHAAGIVVCNEPISMYAGVDSYHGGVAMMDKYEAESLNLLKIDVLGLRTLSIIEQCIDDVGISYEEMYQLPLDDKGAFNIFNDMRLAGIFQFEGYALQSLTRQMGVREFNDIAAITALARPGPLHNGGATAFIERRTGKAPITYYSNHPAVVKHTENELGTFIYQEQIMSIGREFGGLSWEDVSSLRKAMSKSLGEEFFGRYEEQFLKGAKVTAGIEEHEAKVVWDNMVTFGSWGFNKSHAVGYGIVSYWSAYLKHHHPREFARACLNHARTPEAAIKILREYGGAYKAIDLDHSTHEWTIHEDQLLGPLTGIHGVGEKMARNIVELRAKGQPLKPGQLKKLENPITPWDDLYPARTLWGEYYEQPMKFGSIKYHRLTMIDDIQEDGDYLFIGKLVDRNLRDHNEYGNVVKRGGKLVRGPSQFLNITLEDDTGTIIATVNRFKYEQYGKEIAESGRINEDWYLVFGEVKEGWRKVYIHKIQKITPKEKTVERDDQEAV